MKVIVAGGGRVGTYLASLLLAEKHNVRVIELRREEIPRLLRDLPPEVVIQGSGTDPSALEAADIGNADVVAAVTGADETNLVVTSLARFEFGVPRTIARVKDPRNTWMFTPLMGVDVALNQADLMSRLIAEEMSMGNMMTLLKLCKGQYSVTEVTVDSSAAVVGQAVRDLQLPTECIFAAIIRKGQLIVPHGDTLLQAEDEVLAVVHASRVGQLDAILRQSR
jgi:trk system potassium uptake protein TrkA